MPSARLPVARPRAPKAPRRPPIPAAHARPPRARPIPAPAPRASRARERASAQTAMARTSGEASPSLSATGSGERNIARIAGGDQNIAHETRGSDPLYRTSRKQSPKSGLIEAKQGFEPRRTEFFARREFDLARGSGEFVPGADGEAVVAAIDAIADRGAKLFRDVALVLDGEIGDAAPRVERRRAREGVGRADVEAGAAGAAMIFFRLAARQRQRRENRAQEQPGAEIARDEVGVLALPADARPPAPAASPSPARYRRTP